MEAVVVIHRVLEMDVNSANVLNHVFVIVSSN